MVLIIAYAIRRALIVVKIISFRGLDIKWGHHNLQNV